MKFEAHVSMDGAAFDMHNEELARILRKLADQAEAGEFIPNDIVRVRDVYGNRVGYAVVEVEG